MTKQEFIEKVRKPAIKMWSDGLGAKDKYRWWTETGNKSDYFCEHFSCLSGYPKCPLRGISTNLCSVEWHVINKSYLNCYAGEIQRASFIRTFTRNVKKLLQRIRDIKYEDIDWGDV